MRPTVGSLIVSTTSLTWTVIKDLRSKALNPTKDAVTRQVRILLRDSDKPTVPDQDKIIDAIVEEIEDSTEE